MKPLQWLLSSIGWVIWIIYIYFLHYLYERWLLHSGYNLQVLSVFT